MGGGAWGGGGGGGARPHARRCLPGPPPPLHTHTHTGHTAPAHHLQVCPEARGPPRGFWLEGLALQLGLDGGILGACGCMGLVVCVRGGGGGVRVCQRERNQQQHTREAVALPSLATTRVPHHHPQRPPEKVSPRHTHSIGRRHFLPGRLKSQAAQSSSAHGWGRAWWVGGGHRPLTRRPPGSRDVSLRPPPPNTPSPLPHPPRPPTRDDG